MMEIKILDERAKEFPNYPAKVSTDAGYDLRAFFQKPSYVDDSGRQFLTLRPNTVKLIPTGLSIHIKERGLVGLLLPRSGLGHKHGLVLGNLTGVIDSGYQGPYMISCWNRSDQSYDLELGERFAQLVFTYVVSPEFTIVDEFSDETARGETGFGESGKQ